MLQAGETLGKWTVESLLRKSGTGASYLCRPTGGGDLAVIKVFDPKSLHRGHERYTRFTKMLGRLNHPGIPRYIGTVQDPPAIACEYHEGVFLNDRLKDGAMAPRAVLSLARELAATLHYLHSEDIIHRSVKPEAVLLATHGQAQLMDFGVALESDEERLTQAGAVVGTLRILPPEAFEMGQEGPAYDLYALGVLLFEAVTGTKAFGNPDGSKVRTTQVLQRKLSTPCLDPGDDVPTALRDMICDLTRQDEAERPASAMAVVTSLQGVKIKSQGPPSAGTDLLANLKAARSGKASKPAAPPAQPASPAPVALEPVAVAAPAAPAPAPRTSPAVQAPQSELPPAAPVDRSLIIAMMAGGALALVGAVLFLMLKG